MSVNYQQIIQEKRIQKLINQFPQVLQNIREHTFLTKKCNQKTSRYKPQSGLYLVTLNNILKKLSNKIYWRFAPIYFIKGWGYRGNLRFPLGEAPRLMLGGRALLGATMIEL